MEGTKLVRKAAITILIVLFSNLLIPPMALFAAGGQIKGITYTDNCPEGVSSDPSCVFAIEVEVWQVDNSLTRTSKIAVREEDPSLWHGAFSGIAEDKSDAHGKFITRDDNLPSGYYEISVFRRVDKWRDTFNRYAPGATAILGCGVGIIAAPATLGGSVVACLGVAALVTVVGGAERAYEKVEDSIKGVDFYEAKAYIYIDTTGNIIPINPNEPNETMTAISRDQYLVIIVNKVKVSPITTSLKTTMVNMSKMTSGLMTFTIGATNTLLNDTRDYVLGGQMLGAWKNIRNISIVMLMLGLIIIAFANVFQIDIERYGLNRVIPKIIIAVILTWFSWIIVAFFFDLSGAIQLEAIHIMNGSNGLQWLSNLNLGPITYMGVAQTMGAYLSAFALIAVTLLSTVTLLFSLFIRVVALSFLLAIAPLAFIFSILPFTEKLFKQWWSEFFKWMFMGPLAVAIIAIGTLIAVPTTTTPTDTQTMLMPFLGSVLQAGRGSALDVMVKVGIMAAAVYFAGTLPMQWGGAAMKAWMGAGKKYLANPLQKAGAKTGGFLWRATGVPGAAKNVVDRTAGFLGRGRNRRENFIASTLTGGLAGTDPAIYRRQQEDATTAEVAKRNNVASSDQKMLIDRHRNTSNRWERSAIEREMAARGDFEKLFAKEDQINEFGGWVDQKDKDGNNIGTDAIEYEARTAAAQRMLELKGSDQTLERTIIDKQGEIAYEAGNIQKESGSYGQGLQGGALAANKGKPPSQKRWKMLQHMQTSDEVAKFADENDIAKAKTSDTVGSKARSEITKAEKRSLFTRQSSKASMASFENEVAEIAGKNPSQEDMEIVHDLMGEEARKNK